MALAFATAFGALLSATADPDTSGETIRLAAKETLTAVELNHGDRLEFALQSGRTVSLALEDTQAAIVERVEPGGIVYLFSCEVRIDGQPITLRRYVCSQECFYEPYMIGGLRIWPDTVKAVFDLVPVRYPRPGHLQCVPRKAARFAVQDATLRICPEETQPWLDEPQDFIDVGRCYNGDDCYLGPYLGKACHVGLDINHPKGSPLLAPLGFDTQAYFNSLAAGHNNNRWRGIRRWENGDVWALQTHHLIDLLRIAADDAAKQIRVAVDATGRTPGAYSAIVEVACDGAVNSPQPFRAILEVRDDLPDGAVTVDDSSAGFYATPYFWVGHRFSRVSAKRRGYRGFYLTNGGVAAPGEFARFTPDLRSGTYAVSLHQATPFGEDVEFDARVRHRGGAETVRVRPTQSREIGEFEFDEGADGYVEILAEGAQGLVVADAVVFRRAAP